MILMDSVLSDTISSNRSSISFTPFIDKLIDQGFFCPTIISSGPYTDAATRSLYTGMHGLDFGGYYFQLNKCPTNNYKVFKDLGYETYGFYYPYYLHGDSIKNSIDHSIYLSGILFESIWDGKLKYYADLKKKRNLSEYEYILLKGIFDIVFQSWTSFYSDIIENNETKILIARLLKGVDTVVLLEQLIAEKQKYSNNPNEYIDSILEMGYQHPLASLEKIDASNFVDKCFLKKNVYKRHKEFFRFSKNLCYRTNKKNNRISKKKAFVGLLNAIKKLNIREARYLINYIRCLYAIPELKKTSLGKKWKNIASAGSQITALESILSSRSQDKPFYVSMHFLESHHAISFFSYDSDDTELIDNEIDYIDKTAKSIPQSFKGNLAYYYSLLYTDYCIKRLYDYLSETGLIKNTVVMLFADHGTSYTYDPIRKNMVNTFHRENYNVPMIIWKSNSSFKLIKKDSYYESKDMLPTLLTLLGFSTPFEMSGSSITNNTSKNAIAITEYMGPGCPDMENREVWISARDFNYVLGCKIRLDEQLDKRHIACIYDCVNDPDELNNIYDSPTAIEKTKYLFDAINNRLMSLKQNHCDFVMKVENNKAI